MKYKTFWYNELSIPEKYQACIDETRKIVPLEVVYKTMDQAAWLRHKPEQSNFDRNQLIMDEADVCYMDADIILHESLDNLEPGIWCDYRYGVIHGALIVSVGDNRQYAKDKYAKMIKRGFHKNMRFGKLFCRCPLIKRIPDEWFTHYFFTTNKRAA